MLVTLLQRHFYIAMSTVVHIHYCKDITLFRTQDMGQKGCIFLQCCLKLPWNWKQKLFLWNTVHFIIIIFYLCAFIIFKKKKKDHCYFCFMATLMHTFDSLCCTWKLVMVTTKHSQFYLGHAVILQIILCNHICAQWIFSSGT